VIFEVERAFGFGAAACVPTGYVRLLIWDVHTSRFTCSLRSSDQNLVLLPPCCGRGSACFHLCSSQPPQWPNGEPMALCDVTPIPKALASFLRSDLLRQPRLQQQQEMEASFKVILGEYYTPPVEDHKRKPLAALVNGQSAKQQKICPDTAGGCSEIGSESGRESGSEIGSESSSESGRESGSESGSERGSESDDSVIQIQEGLPDDDQRQSWYEACCRRPPCNAEYLATLDWGDAYDEDQLEYEAALESDGFCSDGSL
jgi:hypothetical protein